MAETSTRVYVVINSTTGEKRLIEATSQSQAIRHCTYPQYKADAASPLTVARMMGDGLKLETATDSKQQTVTT